MGKKFNEFTQDDKSKILSLHNDGKLNKEIAVIMSTSTSMIYIWVNIVVISNFLVRVTN